MTLEDSAVLTWSEVQEAIEEWLRKKDLPTKKATPYRVWIRDTHGGGVWACPKPTHRAVKVTWTYIEETAPQEAQ